MKKNCTKPSFFIRDGNDALVIPANNFRNTMLKLRILTAFILIPLVIGGIFYLSSPAFMAITAIIMLLGSWEWSRLSGLIDIKYRVLYVALQGLILLLLMFFPGLNPWRGIIVFGLIFLGVSLYLFSLGAKKACVTDDTAYAKSGVRLVNHDLMLGGYSGTPFNTFLSVVYVTDHFDTDTAAYASGRLWGQHLLAPTLSPKKTWEGMIIGLLVTFLAGLLIQTLFKGVKHFFRGNIFNYCCHRFSLHCGRFV